MLRNAAGTCGEGDKLLDSRDASAEEGSSTGDEDVGKSDDNGSTGRMEEDSDSSCSHDMTLTMTSSSTSCGGSGACIDNNKSKIMEFNMAGAKKINEFDAIETPPIERTWTDEKQVLTTQVEMPRTRRCKQEINEVGTKGGEFGSGTDISQAELSDYWDQVRMLYKFAIPLGGCAVSQKTCDFVLNNSIRS